MYLRPLRQKALSLLGLSRDNVEDACAKRWQIAPAENLRASPALYDQADLAHVRGTAPDSTVEKELNRLVCKIQNHAATTAFLLKNVEVVDGYVYGPRWKLRLLPVAAPIRAAAPDVRFGRRSLACSWSGNIYFGHWVTDDLTLHLAAEELSVPFTLEREPYLHEPQYRELLGIPPSALRRARLDEMILIEDYGQNDYKRKRYDILRTRLGEHCERPGSEYVFLRRGARGQPRTIVNAEEVEGFLRSQGFDIVDPDTLTPVEIARRLFGARIVISVEGSHVVHAILAMAKGGALCCIQPPWRFNNIHRGHAECPNVRYAIVVGHDRENGFHVEMDGLKRILDEIDAALAGAHARRSHSGR